MIVGFDYWQVLSHYPEQVNHMMEMHSVIGDTIHIVSAVGHDREGTVNQYGWPLSGDPDANNDDEHYYYITTRPGSNQAIANLLDRAFGKPKENIELGEDPDAPLPVHGTGTTTELRKAMLVMIKQQIKDGGKK